MSIVAYAASVTLTQHLLPLVMDYTAGREEMLDIFWEKSYQVVCIWDTILEACSTFLYGQWNACTEVFRVWMDAGEPSSLRSEILGTLLCTCVWWLQTYLVAMVVAHVCCLMHSLVAFVQGVVSTFSDYRYRWTVQKVDWRQMMMSSLPFWPAYQRYVRRTQCKTMQMSLLTSDLAFDIDNIVEVKRKPEIVKEMAIPGNPQHETASWPEGLGILLDSNSTPTGFCVYVCDPALKSKHNPYGQCLRYTGHQQRGINAVGGKIAVVGQSGSRSAFFDVIVLRRISGYNGDILCAKVPANFGSVTGIKRAVMRKFDGAKPVKVMSLPKPGSSNLRYSTSEANAVGLLISYKASTSPGSSGSPIYQGSFVVGTHVQSRKDPTKGVCQNEGALWFMRPIGIVSKESPWSRGDGYSMTDEIHSPQGYFRDSWLDEEADRMEERAYAAADHQIAELRERANPHFQGKYGYQWADSDDEDEAYYANQKLSQDQLQDKYEAQNRIRKEASEHWQTVAVDADAYASYSSCEVAVDDDGNEVDSPPVRKETLNQDFTSTRTSPPARVSQGATKMHPMTNLRVDTSGRIYKDGKPVATMKSPKKVEKSATEEIDKEGNKPPSMEKQLQKKEETLEMFSFLRDDLLKQIATMREEMQLMRSSQIAAVAQSTGTQGVKQGEEVQPKGVEPELVAQPKSPPTEIRPKSKQQVVKERASTELKLISETTQGSSSLPSEAAATATSQLKKAKKKKSKAQTAKRNASETKPSEESVESRPLDQIQRSEVFQLMNLLKGSGLSNSKTGAYLIEQLELRNGACTLKPESS